MASTSDGGRSARAWRLAKEQHWVVTRRDLLRLGFTRAGIEHRLADGRLRPVARRVYAVGRPQLGREGRWMAAVLACGSDAALSHRSAAALWEIGFERGGVVEVSVRRRSRPRRVGIRPRERPALSADELTRHRAIRVTTPARTLLDLSLEVGPETLERLVNQADSHDLLSPVELYPLLSGRFSGEPGVVPLRALLAPHFFRLTDSELEIRFRPLARRAGLPEPETRIYLHGFRVDFLFRSLGLVVEADSLRYHRTPATQAREALRDQIHTAAGLTTLRFTHWQISYDPEHVVSVLQPTAKRLRGGG